MKFCQQTIVVTTPTPTPLPTTAVPTGHPICTHTGYVRDPHDCAVFYQCIANDMGGWTMYTYRCSGGTVFDEISLSCTWPSLVTGCEAYTDPGVEARH
jgi:hypothetical protein